LYRGSGLMSFVEHGRRLIQKAAGGEDRERDLAT
jgi:hypothetical protein